MPSNPCFFPGYSNMNVKCAFKDKPFEKENHQTILALV